MADLSPVLAADARRSLTAQLAALGRYDQLLDGAEELARQAETTAVDHCLAEGDAVVADLALEAVTLEATRIALADPACCGPVADAIRELMQQVAQTGGAASTRAWRLSASLRGRQRELVQDLSALEHEREQRQRYTSASTTAPANGHRPAPLLLDTTG